MYIPKSSEDQKKGLHVFRRPLYPPKSSENQKRKGQRGLRCTVSTVSLTADMYQLIFQRKGGGGGGGAGAPALSPKSELSRISKQKLAIGFEFCFNSKVRMIILIKLFDFACHGKAHCC